MVTIVMNDYPKFKVLLYSTSILYCLSCIWYIGRRFQPFCAFYTVHCVGCARLVRHRASRVGKWWSTFLSDLCSCTALLWLPAPVSSPSPLVCSADLCVSWRSLSIRRQLPVAIAIASPRLASPRLLLMLCIYHMFSSGYQIISKPDRAPGSFSNAR